MSVISNTATELDAVPNATATETETETNPEAKNRHCLMCRDTFLSQWAGERVCPKCKSTSAWRSG